MSAFCIKVKESEAKELNTLWLDQYGPEVMGHIFKNLNIENYPIKLRVEALFQEAVAKQGLHWNGDPQEMNIRLYSYLEEMSKDTCLSEERDFTRFWVRLKLILPKEVSLEMDKIAPSSAERRAYLEHRKDHLQHLTQLDLSGLGLTSLPKEISLFSSLTALNLSGNPEINWDTDPSLLKGLTKLFLNANNLTAIPHQIFHLKNLTHLELMNNAIKELPENILALQNLTLLRVDHNKLRALPEEISGLGNLTTFSATFNEIEYLPDNFGKLNNLNFLYLHENKINCFPYSFSELANLRILSMGNNWIRELPADLEKLLELETLILTNNHIFQINPNLKKLPKLKTLLLDDNRIQFVNEHMFNMGALTYFSCFSKELVSTDETMKKFFLPDAISALSPADQTQLTMTYLALGSNKWMEFIDGEHHHLGEFVFDHPRYDPVANRTRPGEPGFRDSMIATLHFLQSQWKTPLTPDFYLEIHRHACSHFEGAYTHTLMGDEGVGKFRDSEKVQAKFPYMEPLAAEEFEGINLELKVRLGPTFSLGYLEYNNDYYPPPCTINYQDMDESQIRLVFNLFAAKFHHEIACAATPHDTLVAIGRLIRHLEWLHAPKDGCGRTDTALLNFLLTAHGFHPVLLEYPYRSSYVSMQEWIEILYEGLNNWETEVNK